MYVCNDLENARERSLDSTDEQLILEGLYKVLDDKREALKTNDECGGPFKARDFAIPQLESLIAYFENEEGA